jgi:hypothetical protein
MGIEPTAQAWEAWVLPLYDARAVNLIVVVPLEGGKSAPKRKGALRRLSDLSNHRWKA